jgi:Ca2+/H+ antiporter, TMEM165/GDT1 family
MEAFLVSLGVVALAVAPGSLAAVTLGSSLGLLLVGAPSVLLGERLVRHLPMIWIRRAAALVFTLLGAAALLGWTGP